MGIWDKMHGKCKVCGVPGKKGKEEMPLVRIHNTTNPYHVCIKCLVEKGLEEIRTKE